jgi:HTH-type transcriptional regulator/antitoxin HipB
MDEYPIKTPRQLGAVLKGWRRERTLTQRDAGARVGLAQKAISNLELAPERSGLGQVFKLLAALDLELVVRPRKRRTSRPEW